MADVTIVQVEDLQDDLKEFLLRAQRRSYRHNLKKVKEYVSKMKSERSVFNRVPLDGGAVISIYNARDRTFNLIKRLMKLVMSQEVLVTLRDYLKVCNHLEVRLQSLIYHIAQCPQYDLEIADIREKLDSMEEIVTKLEMEYKNDENTSDELLETCGVLKFTENAEEEDDQEGDDNDGDDQDDDEFEDAREETQWEK
ncbi:hypothetical protein GCK72_024357 [Caenorhabditis remanei]|uniref:Uncharacterized protein n=1 Tax=Caenorhabditis remanei TaxID=31234 RepID=A0A6A5FZI1_CAERE|nr:hypothetical protein GCK72_024357 [Caenorhabditis remanei]KAF1747891.1 hypothetical protein GCK72_024357 [Caenorhabditis remanei]